MVLLGAKRFTKLSQQEGAGIHMWHWEQNLKFKPRAFKEGSEWVPCSHRLWAPAPLLSKHSVEQLWSFMECTAGDADKGLREDLIWWKESHGSKAIQGKISVRSEQVMAHVGLHLIFPPTGSILASCCQISEVHHCNFQKGKINSVNYGVTLTSPLYNEAVSCSLSKIVKVMILEMNFSFLPTFFLSSFCTCPYLTQALKASQSGPPDADLLKSTHLSSPSLFPWTHHLSFLPHPSPLVCGPLRNEYWGGLIAQFSGKSPVLSEVFNAVIQRRESMVTLSTRAQWYKQWYVHSRFLLALETLLPSSHLCTVGLAVPRTQLCWFVMDFGSQILPSSLDSSKDFASSFRKVLPSSAPTSLHALKKMKLKRESNWVIKRRKTSQKRFFMSNMEKIRGPHGWFCCCVTSSLFSESRAIILITSWQNCLYFPYRFLF